jgi:hypothetical protein
MSSQAAKQAKAGFWIGAGIWAFAVVMLLVLGLAVKALGER